MGSEPGMGWNWIIHLAKYCEVFVISEGEFREQCEEASKGLPIKWYWNPVSDDVRKMCWNQGDWRFYKYYEQWQRKTADIARGIIRDLQTSSVQDNTIVSQRDIVKNPDGSPSHSGEGRGEGLLLHQLNMIGFREPGYLWQVSKETGVPFVWGPVDAKEGFPMAYTEGAPLKNKLFLYLKNAITRFQLKHDKRVSQAARQASIIFSASSNSVHAIKKYMNLDSVLMNETGCHSLSNQSLNYKENESHNSFKLLWIGKLDFRKQLPLALRTISSIRGLNVTLDIVGGGEAKMYKGLADELDVSKLVNWHGAVSHEQVQMLMRESDLLFFTSVAEGTPHVVLEAIANGLPVICFNTCGHGDVVTEDIGVKIPLTNPTQSIKDFAEKITYLYNHPEELQCMSENCRERAEELSWDNKAKQMVSLYEQIIHK